MGTEQSASAFGYDSTRRNRWVSGTVAGLASGLVFGVLLQSMGMMPTIASLYGSGSVVVGWLAHMVHSVVFALVFVAVLRLGPFEQYDGRLVPTLLLAIGYGIVLWVFGAAIVMPAWLSVVTTASPTVPVIDMQSLVGHVVYGVVLGTVYPVAAGTVDLLPRRGEQAT
jgi:hypothetical protein